MDAEGDATDDADADADDNHNDDDNDNNDDDALFTFFRPSTSLRLCFFIFVIGTILFPPWGPG